MRRVFSWNRLSRMGGSESQYVRPPFEARSVTKLRALWAYARYHSSVPCRYTRPSVEIAWISLPPMMQTTASYSCSSSNPEARSNQSKKSGRVRPEETTAWRFTSIPGCWAIRRSKEVPSPHPIRESPMRSTRLGRGGKGGPANSSGWALSAVGAAGSSAHTGLWSSCVSHPPPCSMCTAERNHSRAKSCGRWSPARPWIAAMGSVMARAT